MVHKQGVYLPEVPQHVFLRSLNKRVCFNSESDYQYYLDRLKRLAKKYSCQIHAYVLMPDYIHLLFTPSSENSALLLLKDLGNQYEKYIKTVLNCSAPLWQRYYKVSHIDSKLYLLSCMCYIELNPVRAGIVKRPSDYLWSSYSQNALSPYSDFIENHPVFLMLGQTLDERQFVYRGLFMRYMENDAIHKIRDSLSHGLFPYNDMQSENKVNSKKHSLLGSVGRFEIKEGGSSYKVFLSD